MAAAAPAGCVTARVRSKPASAPLVLPRRCGRVIGLGRVARRRTALAAAPEQEEPGSSTPPTPREAFDEGYAEGYAVGYAKGYECRQKEEAAVAAAEKSLAAALPGDAGDAAPRDGGSAGGCGGTARAVGEGSAAGPVSDIAARRDRVVLQEVMTPVTLNVGQWNARRGSYSGDLEERLLHQWAALRRRELFPRTPFLYAHEWAAGNAGLNFKGDMLLWDGRRRFCAVELKHNNGVGWDAKKGKVEKQALVAQVMAAHFLAEERRELQHEERLVDLLGSALPKSTFHVHSSLTYQGALPTIDSMVLTNELLPEHMQLERARRLQLRADYEQFREGVVIRKKRAAQAMQLQQDLPGGKLTPAVLRERLDAAGEEEVLKVVRGSFTKNTKTVTIYRLGKRVSKYTKFKHLHAHDLVDVLAARPDEFKLLGSAAVGTRRVALVKKPPEIAS